MPSGGGAIYDLALTHRSSAFEEEMGPGEHNERLELLGDSILGAVVTDLAYRRWPEMTEGELARLRATVVNTGALASVAESLDLGAHVRLGKGEEAAGGRDKPKLLANVFEALVGAVYLDRGFAATYEALESIFVDLLDSFVEQGTRVDTKTVLQARSVAAGRDRPTYQVFESGPQHRRSFTATVYVHGEPLGTGDGSSKKEAEQNAARDALLRLDSAADPLKEKDGHGARAS
ncbi:MAG: ribonuclease III [Actinomycetota bacterium]